MGLGARYFDGATADPREVECTLVGSGENGSLSIKDAADQSEVALWPIALMRAVYARRGDLRLALEGANAPARLAFSGAEASESIRHAVPAIDRKRRAERRRQGTAIGVATTVLGLVLGLYIYGIPLLADQLSQFVPPEWEQRMGETVAGQIEESVGAQYGFKNCDPDGTSMAGAAVARFVDKVTGGKDMPFEIRVTFAKSSMANAFALPGGRVYYFSELIDQARGPDEFAGVLAHEIGHIAHRDAMSGLIANAGTGLLIGFVLGDLTGVSVAGAFGAAVIDSRFSREAESDADQFAGEIAKNLGYDPGGLADLLDRVAVDEPISAALSFLNSHPLTQERRVALETMRAEYHASAPAFSKDEWKAIKGVCKGF